MKNRVFLRILTIDDFIHICRNLKHLSKRKRLWLLLIKHNKLTCPITGLTVNNVKEVQYPNGTIHLDFFSDDVEINIDHIKPKSKGGKDNIDNIQPMEKKANLMKADNF